MLPTSIKKVKGTLQRIFKLEENRTTVSREILAGLTTFAAMAYALTVNPGILADAGMDKAALVTITALSGAVATILMALLANYPLAMAPSMGINAIFTYTICRDMGTGWSDALGMVFINGILFFILSVTNVRARIVDSLPYSLKIAITCGIGLFIAFLGLQKGGIVVADRDTLLAASNFATPEVALCLGGIIFTMILVTRRVPGAIIIGIIATTIAGAFITGANGRAITHLDLATARWLPASPEPHFFKLTFGFLSSWDAFIKAVPVILVLLLISMFDSIGTLIGVAKRAGLLRDDGSLPRIGRVFVADSVAAACSALFGTSTVVSYAESASGVEAGGRTGLTGVTVAVLMLLALFLTPVILCIPNAAIAPALIIVGVFMMQSVVEIKMDDFTTAAPAVLTIMAIPLTFSIANGIGIGILASVMLALFTGRARSITVIGYIIAVIFFLKFFQLFPFNHAG
ncbi:AGZA family xanthine/uracil permease-like MFS transporter [Ereboglobus sp. PH5-5]|uniref:NCS2 family permease n=1 Tax=Ereboglobus sp. PH5-5 TaxID=2940529 RepID=UPI0024061BA1|nr:NCS2 family permease [Ereboglobus sp. PH5-5]MDF9832233.1 AGZA family xanthine/uracil permease-like MFS transporter [Ereboglobus sp. PH5-5]